MKNSDNEALDLDSFLKISSGNYLWYFWSQHPDLTVKEVTGININYKIKSKDVELVQEGQSHGIFPLQDLVGSAKKNGMDVIELNNSSGSYTKVMVARFSSFKELYVSQIGLFSKKRPWIVCSNDNKTVGLKIVQDGYPRSRDRVNDGDLRNEKELLHRNHLDEHKCALKADGRVLKKYRKSIKVEPKNFICKEINSEFISELLSE